MGLVNSAGSASDFLHAFMQVPPLLWSMDLEKSNQKFLQQKFSLGHQNYTVWNFLSERSRSRGMVSLSNKSWPGSVHLPSFVIERLFSNGSLKRPEHWSFGKSNDLSSRLVSLLSGWHQDRLVYGLDELPSRIVANAEINVPMALETFSSFPSFSFYVDVENVKSLEGMNDLPDGFLVGVNMDRQPELVFVYQKSSNQPFVVDVLPLKGSDFDQEMRQQCVGKGADGLARARCLSAMVAATLMVRLYHFQSESDNDRVPGFSTLKSWNRFSIKNHFSERIHEQWVLSSSNSNGIPQVVSQFGVFHDKNSQVSLMCLIGKGMSFDRFLKPPIKKKKKSTSGLGKKKEVNDDLDDFFPVKKAMRPKGPKKKPA